MSSTCNGFLVKIEWRVVNEKKYITFNEIKPTENNMSVEVTCRSRNCSFVRILQIRGERPDDRALAGSEVSFRIVGSGDSGGVVRSRHPNLKEGFESVGSYVYYISTLTSKTI